MKLIDKVEERVLYMIKKRQGKKLSDIKLEIKRDKDFQKDMLKQQKLKKEKKTPKEIDEEFKQGVGDLR